MLVCVILTLIQKENSLLKPNSSRLVNQKRAFVGSLSNSTAATVLLIFTFKVETIQRCQYVKPDGVIDEASNFHLSLIRHILSGISIRTIE